MRKERKIENTNLDCLFFFVYLLWFSIRGFTNILISIPAKPGPYPVGLKVVDQYDHSRAYPGFSKNLSKSSVGDDARPLQTLIWYPSLRSTGKPMTVDDYTQLADTEIHFDAPHPEQNRWRSLLKISSEIPLWAVRDAKPAKGDYPVLIYAPSDSSVSWENADLCEYLASHGYVILASPSMGVPNPIWSDRRKHAM
ncbi:MAG: hypothetical protein WCA27_11815 [Candidatus Sulfotelmatobacter sp.]